jgi:Zn-dependent M28 family amino/carboxypeptidase
MVKQRASACVVIVVALSLLHSADAYDNGYRGSKYKSQKNQNSTISSSMRKKSGKKGSKGNSTLDQLLASIESGGSDVYEYVKTSKGGGKKEGKGSSSDKWEGEEYVDSGKGDGMYTGTETSKDEWDSDEYGETDTEDGMHAGKGTSTNNLESDEYGETDTEGGMNTGKGTSTDNSDSGGYEETDTGGEMNTETGSSADKWNSDDYGGSGARGGKKGGTERSRDKGESDEYVTKGKAGGKKGGTGKSRDKGEYVTKGKGSGKKGGTGRSKDKGKKSHDHHVKGHKSDKIGKHVRSARGGKEGDANVSVFDASQRLRDAVSFEGILHHLEAFENAAKTLVGIRSVGTAGYDDSVKYVSETLKKAGYEVKMQTLMVDIFKLLQPSEMGVVGGRQYKYGYDFFEFDYIRSSFVEARTQLVKAYGCEKKDYTDFVPGSIAIMMRNEDGNKDCNLIDQSTNAVTAGAVGIVFYNDAERQDAFIDSFRQFVIDIPVFGSSYNVGLELARGVFLRMYVNALNIENVETKNIITETSGGDEGYVVVAGAHLDSVDGGPGINDNGSGSATILEIAVQMSTLGIQPCNKIRFGWWGAKEVGLVGSQYYVTNLTKAEQDQIATYLNFDTISSPNFIRVVYAPVQKGEEDIAQIFMDFFDAYNMSYIPLDDEYAFSLNGNSDQFSFQDEAGIPSSGIFTGNSSIKTEEQALLFGGNAGEPFDPCWHEACDDIANLNPRILDEMADAASHAIFTIANMKQPNFRHSQSRRATTAKQRDNFLKQRRKA